LTKLFAEQWAAHLGGKIARLWNTYGWEDPDIRSHVVTDLVVSGLFRHKVVTITTGQERRRFMYKADCVKQLISFFDSNRMSTDIAGDKWITISELAMTVAGQLGVDYEHGTAAGEELIIDPVNPYPWIYPLVSLEQGISLVVSEARQYRERYGR
jgi:hypothetical protein